MSSCFSSTRLSSKTFEGRTYCTLANLFGDQLGTWTATAYMGVTWATFKNLQHSMQRWNMKIRPHGVDLSGNEKTYGLQYKLVQLVQLMFYFAFVRNYYIVTHLRNRIKCICLAVIYYLYTIFHFSATHLR